MQKRIKQFVKVIERNTKKIFLVSIVLLLVLILVNTILIGVSSNVLNKKVNEIEEFNRPLEIRLSIIDCTECSDVSSVVNNIKSKNVEVINEETLDRDSEEAKELISKYNIQKLPAILIFGEIDNDKITFNDFELKDDALVLSKIFPPYLDVETNELKGIVSLIEIIDSSCEQCTSLSFMLDTLGQAGVVTGDWKKIEYNSQEGIDLISKQDIKQIPAMLFSDDIEEYEGMKEFFAQLESTNKNGYYGIHAIIPPYRNITTGKINGLVDLIMLTDNSCSECYDVEINKQILQGLGIIPNSENTYDVSSSNGQQLISKYNIKKIPMILVSPEANVYEAFVQAWSSVGSIDNDGWYVMTNPEVIGETIPVN